MAARNGAIPGDHRHELASARGALPAFFSRQLHRLPSGLGSLKPGQQGTQKYPSRNKDAHGVAGKPNKSGRAALQRQHAASLWFARLHGDFVEGRSPLKALPDYFKRSRRNGTRGHNQVGAQARGSVEGVLELRDGVGNRGSQDDLATELLDKAREEDRV